MTIQQIAVVGAGTLGTEIAQSCAAVFMQVTLIDISPDALERARHAIRRRVDALLAQGKITSEAHAAALAMRTTTDIDTAHTADLAIEAGPEVLSVKKDILSALDEVLQPQALLASSTSAYTVTALAALTNRPDRVIGLHFVNPASRSQLVEVIPGVDTSTTTRDTVLEMVQALGKTAVLTGDFPGFISYRVLYPMINEAITALLENVGTVEAIDTVFRLGFEHPMGPLMLADYLGLDTILTVMDALWDTYRTERFRASPLLRQLVQAGHTGRKCRRGFYAYDDSGCPTGPAYP